MLVTEEDFYRRLETPGPERTAWEQDAGKRVKDLARRPGFDDALRRTRAHQSTPQPARQVEVRGSVVFSLEEVPGSDVMVVQRRRGAETRTLFRAGDAASRERIDFVNVSPRGKLVAIGLSDGGTEETTVHVVDAETGRELPDRSLDVRNTAFSWLPDESGYVYMRGRGRKNVPVTDHIRDLSVALHVLGHPDDREIVGSRAPGKRIHEEFEYCYPTVSPDGKYVEIAVRHGLNPDLKIFAKPRAALFDPAVEWRLVFDESERVEATSAGRDRIVAVRTLPDGTNVVEERSLTSSKPRVLYTSSRPLDGVVAAGSSTYVIEVDVATKRLVHVASTGKATPVPLPAGRSIWSDTVRYDVLSERLVLDLRSWAAPASWWVVPKGGTKADPIAEVTPPGQRDEDFEVRQLEAVARDGEKIPITVVSRADSKGPHHVWAAAYGSYGYVIGPTFTIARRTFLELGGTYVFAHVRGGGEKGRAWHDAGRGVNKLKTVEDYIDAIKFLREQGFGKGGGIMAHGVSAGGIPIGGLLVRNPDLVDGAIIESGVVNVSRLEEGSAIGALHVEEIGTSKTPEGAQRLQTLDVFANVRPGLKYPPVYLLAGVNDARVPYWQTTKLAAKLLRSGAENVYLRLTGGGHISGTTQDEEATVKAEIVTFALSSTHHPDFK